MTTDNQLTRADQGVLVFETLTSLLNAALVGKDPTTALSLRNEYKDAVEHLAEATGARFTAPAAVSTLSDSDKAVILAQTIKRTQQFVMAQLKTSKFQINVTPPFNRLKNVIDHQQYSLLAIVTVDADQRVLYFAQSVYGQCVFSDKVYWENV